MWLQTPIGSHRQIYSGCGANAKHQAQTPYKQTNTQTIKQTSTQTKALANTPRNTQTNKLTHKQTNKITNN